MRAWKSEWAAVLEESEEALTRTFKILLALFVLFLFISCLFPGFPQGIPLSKLVNKDFFFLMVVLVGLVCLGLDHHNKRFRETKKSMAPLENPD